MRWLRLCRIAHHTEKSRSRACARIDNRVRPPACGSLVHLCKSSAGDGHGRPLGAAQNVNPGFELLGERVDDAGSEAGFRLGEDANGCADSVAGNIHAVNVVFSSRLI